MIIKFENEYWKRTKNDLWDPIEKRPEVPLLYCSLGIYFQILSYPLKDP
jgi:hypothetical protein